MSVTDKALKIGLLHPELNPDLEFIEEAAMIHDIGIFMTNAPNLFTVLANTLTLPTATWDANSLPVWVFPNMVWFVNGIQELEFQKKRLTKKNYPCPHRDLIPETVEEQIIAFADKFYSKSKDMCSKRSH